MKIFRGSLFKSIFATALFLSFLTIGSCSAIQTVPGAERIIVTKNAPPAGCKFVGTITGGQGGSFSGAWTSNKNMAEGAFNDMKNKAFQLGANFVQIEFDQAGTTGSGNQWGFSQQQTDVTKTGNAYRCNPDDIGL